jgi:hypothetical protein
VALRREQREQFENNHCENETRGKEGEANYRRHKHGLRKRRRRDAFRLFGTNSLKEGIM